MVISRKAGRLARENLSLNQINSQLRNQIFELKSNAKELKATIERLECEKADLQAEQAAQRNLAKSENTREEIINLQKAFDDANMARAGQDGEIRDLRKKINQMKLDCKQTHDSIIQELQEKINQMETESKQKDHQLASSRDKAKRLKKKIAASDALLKKSEEKSKGKPRKI